MKMKCIILSPFPVRAVTFDPCFVSQSAPVRTHALRHYVKHVDSASPEVLCGVDSPSKW